MRSGNISLDAEYMRAVGIFSGVWSSSAETADDVYRLAINRAGVIPSHGPSYRHNGFSFRCLQEWGNPGIFCIIED